MASNATVFKAVLQISDVDRGYYHDHALTLARHPSETDERMMVRLLAFVLHAHEALAFGRGLSTEDEPDLWQKDLTGAIELWIVVGQRDEKSIRQACGRAKQVFIYTYGGRGADLWWEQNRAKLVRLDNRLYFLHSMALPFPRVSIMMPASPPWSKRNLWIGWIKNIYWTFLPTALRLIA